MAGSEMKYVGVDGCKIGWFSVGLDDGAGFKVKVFPSFSKLTDYYSDAKLILVDMPIGFDSEGKVRACDTEARKKLGRPRSSSIFPVPSRRLLEEVGEIDSNLKYRDRYAKAKQLSKRIDGKGLASQSYAITPKMIEVDAVVRNYDNVKHPDVREVHPEVCFWALNPHGATQNSKKTKEGLDERIGILKRYEIYENQVDNIRQNARTKYPHKSKVGEDDILDALALAITAKLGCGESECEIRTLPTDPPKDKKCLPMEMVYVRPKS